MDTTKTVMLVLGILVLGAGLYYYFAPTAPADQSAAVIESQPLATMRLTSSAFENGGTIPEKFTCDAGTPPSPALSFEDVPEGTVSLALIMDDPDVPTEVKPEGVFDHWVLFNIDASVSEIPEGSTTGTPGANGRGASVYAGPCPPPQYEPTEHRYFFRLYALDATLDLPAGSTKAEVLAAMDGHILSTAELMGTYDRAE